MPPRVGIMLSCVGWGIPLSKGGSEQGHMIVSLAVGQNQMEKELLKQCLKNTWRHTQKTCCCFSFRAPRMRSAGVGDVGTLSCLYVHLQTGRGVRSCPHTANAACLGVEEGGWCGGLQRLVNGVRLDSNSSGVGWARHERRHEGQPWTSCLGGAL